MALELRAEEVLLVDIKLVVKPVNIVGLDGLSQIPEGFQVGDLSEP